jgi:hypothetical protein
MPERGSGVRVQYYSGCGEGKGNEGESICAQARRIPHLWPGPAVGPTRSVCGRRYLKSALPRPSIGHGFELLHASHPICRVGFFFFSRSGASATLVRTQTRAPPERERISRSCLLGDHVREPALRRSSVRPFPPPSLLCSCSCSSRQALRAAARRKKKVHAGRHARDHRCGSLLTTWCGLQLSDQGSSADTRLFPSDSSASR